MPFAYFSDIFNVAGIILVVIRKSLTDLCQSEFLHQYEMSISILADYLFDQFIKIADIPQQGESITIKA